MKKLFEDPSMIVVPFLAAGEDKLGPDELPIIPIEPTVSGIDNMQ